MTCSYDAEVLADDPILYWKCNEGTGTTLTDTSGNGNDGTITGNASLTTSGNDLLPTHGSFLDLNRTGTRDGYAYINPVPAEWPTTAATFEIWYHDTTYTPTPDGAGILSYCTSSANTGNNWMLWWDPQMEYQLHVNESNTDDGFQAGGVCPLADWHAPKHLVVTWNGTTGVAKLYINGNLVESKTRSQYQATLTGGGAFVVGQDQDSVLGGFTAAQAFAANVSNIAVYNTVLSAERIKAHWDVHAADAFVQYFDASPESTTTGTTDTVPPTVTISTSNLSDIDTTDYIDIAVTDDQSLDNLNVEIWVEYAARSELVYDGTTAAVNYSVSVTEAFGDLNYRVTPLGAGWADDFTIVVRARDTNNTTTEEKSYTLSTADNYPPHMDPYT